MELTDIRKIAFKAREDFENKEINVKLLMDLYVEYNSSVKDIDSFINKSKKIFPKLNCGLTTIYLKKILGEGEIVQGKYKNKKHTFLLVDRKIIVDITADQYGGDNVYVGPITSPWQLKEKI